MLGSTVGVAVVVLLGLGGCGGDDDAPAAADTDDGADVEPASDSEADAQALVFAQCMRENGIDMSDPAPGQDGFFDAFHSTVDRYDQGELQAAMAACDPYFPTYGGMGAAHGGDDEATLALADCLRDQGLDVPDNLFEDGALLDLDRDELGAAMEACRDVVAGGDG